MKAGPRRAPSRTQPIRWSLAMMSREFGPDPKTLAKNQAASGVTAGADGLFSSRDALRLVCGDIDAERLRKIKQEADKLELDNARARGELLDLEDYLRRSEGIAAQHKQRILALPIPDADKDVLLNDIADLYSSTPKSGSGQ